MKWEKEHENIKEGLKNTKIYWHICVMGVWGLYNQLKCMDKIHGSDHVVSFNLPASYEGIYKYEAGELLHNIEGKGSGPNMEQSIINLNHLTTLMSFIDTLVEELCSEVKIKKDKKKSRTQKILEELNILNGEDSDEFFLARQIRNAYIHNLGNATKSAADKYKELRKEEKLTEGQKINLDYNDFEGWHNLILKISEDLKKTATHE